MFRKKPDESFGLHPAAARHWRADNDVLLAGIAGEQPLKCREHGHEERRALTPSQRAEPRGQARGQIDGLLGSAITSYGWPRVIGGERQSGGCTGELLAPVGELILQHLPLEPPPLPVGVVGVLDRQFRQDRAVPSRQRPVEFTQFAQ